MKNSVWVVMMVLMAAVMVLSGCGAPGMTSNEVERRHRDYLKQNMLMLQDDFDSIWMIDRPSRLTPYTTR